MIAPDHGPATLVLSLDFELHWGVRDKVGRTAFAKQAVGARDAAAWMLELFEDNDVACTWATVGALMARDSEELGALWPAHMPSYHRAAFDASVELSRGIQPELHLAHRLVERIARSRRQELATHTFSHFLCAEKGADVETFRADLEAAKKAAALHGIRLQSIVFPRNQITAPMLRICREEGLCAYRGHARWPDGGTRRTEQHHPLLRLGRLAESVLPLARPLPAHAREDEHGMVNVPASRFFRVPLIKSARTSQLALRKVLAEMRTVAERGGLYHLWWHPHNLAIEDSKSRRQLECVVRHFCYLRSRFGMVSSSMAEVATRVRQGEQAA